MKSKHRGKNKYSLGNRSHEVIQYVTKKMIHKQRFLNFAK